MRETLAQGVGPALVQQVLEGGAALGLKQGVGLPRAGIVDVGVGRDDIVVAAENDRRLSRIKRRRVGDEPVGPG